MSGLIHAVDKCERVPCRQPIRAFWRLPLVFGIGGGIGHRTVVHVEHAIPYISRARFGPCLYQNGM